MHLLLTLPNNPQAKGLVKKINGVIGEGLRKMLLAIPEAKVDKVLIKVLAGLQMLPTQLGWQPYLLVFK